MDEPTSALDTKSVNSLLEWIKNRNKKEITLIITHDERILKICDKIINLWGNIMNNDYIKVFFDRITSQYGRFSRLYKVF